MSSTGLPALRERGGKDADAVSLLSPPSVCSLKMAPRSTPVSTYQQNRLASVGRVHSTHAHPVLRELASLAHVLAGSLPCPSSSRVWVSLWGIGAGGCFTTSSKIKKERQTSLY